MPSTRPSYTPKAAEESRIFDVELAKRLHNAKTTSDSPLIREMAKDVLEAEMLLREVALQLAQDRMTVAITARERVSKKTEVTMPDSEPLETSISLAKHAIPANPPVNNIPNLVCLEGGLIEEDDQCEELRSLEEDEWDKLYREIKAAQLCDAMKRNRDEMDEQGITLDDLPDLYKSHLRLIPDKN